MPHSIAGSWSYFPRLKSLCRSRIENRLSILESGFFLAFPLSLNRPLPTSRHGFLAAIFPRKVNFFFSNPLMSFRCSHQEWYIPVLQISRIRARLLRPLFPIQAAHLPNRTTQLCRLRLQAEDHHCSYRLVKGFHRIQWACLYGQNRIRLSQSYVPEVPQHQKV